MPSETTIARVSVEALHGQFDVTLNFNPGLNVIYGKNGTGKTTILHLLGNALELDFSRFHNINFSEIEIENNRREILRLEKYESSGAIRMTLDGSPVGILEYSKPLVLDDGRIRDVLGPRSTYLPAFRSVLERARTDSSTYQRLSTERRDSDFEEVADRELKALKEVAASGTPYEQIRTLRDAATITAQKTSICRQWFGQFVPVIRYPSVADVDDALSDEWRSAQLQVSSNEQQMFENIFVKVFETIAGVEKNPSEENSESLLASIQELLNEQDTQLGAKSDSAYNAISRAARTMGGNSQPPALRAVENSLLYIYRQTLKKRNTERRLAFQRSHDFENSINKFLDSKELVIGRLARARHRSVVSVVTKSKHSYGMAALSSGERQILTMLYCASRSKFISGVFLIDEPELSLHIDWQRIVLAEIQTQSPGRQIIACTHSPEVGAEHLDCLVDFDPKPTRTSRSRQSMLFNEEEN